MNKLNVPPSAGEVLKVIDAYEIIHIRTAEMKSDEEWSSQFWTQFMQLRKRPSEKKKNSGLQRGLNPWSRNTGAML